MREQGMFDPARLVFIDETCTHTKMVRPYGRSPRGERLIGYAPHGHWKTITFVAGRCVPKNCSQRPFELRQGGATRLVIE
jgi:hypothetical protein